MKILALETNVQKIQKTFIVDGEELLLSVHPHFFIFLFPMIFKTIVALVALFLITSSMILFVSPGAELLMSWVLFIVLWIYAYECFTSYVEWRFNFLIVTTMKIIIVHQHSIFHHTSLPIHLENISSLSFTRQFYGIGHCGVLHIHLMERRGGSTSDIVLRYTPSPDIVTGVMENASALLSQKSQEGEKKEDQIEKIESVQHKGEEAKGSVPPPPAEATQEATESSG